MISRLTAQAIDEVLAGSFPASDPPAWSPGIATVAPSAPPPSDTRERRDVELEPGFVDVSRPPAERTVGQSLVSLAAVGGLALLVPFAVLGLATPIGLGVRGLLELAGQVLALVR